jgi:uncharacterized membrane protein
MTALTAPQPQQTATRPQAYQSLGPEATRLHRAYLAARRAWNEARHARTAAWYALTDGTISTADYQAAMARARDAYEAMRTAQTAAAHAERGI